MLWWASAPLSTDTGIIEAYAEPYFQYTKVRCSLLLVPSPISITVYSKQKSNVVFAEHGSDLNCWGGISEIITFFVCIVQGRGKCEFEFLNWFG